MSSMMTSVMLAVNINKVQHEKINNEKKEKVQVEKQIEKIEKGIAKSVKKMEAMESIWWDDNKVWLSMY
jgi:flagellar biosynthesis regulator FlaF